MFPEYSRTPTQRLMYDPSDWLSPDPTKMSKKKTSYCHFFAKNLTRLALLLFARQEGNSIDNFIQLVSAFLNKYSVFIETRITEANLSNLKQEPFKPLRSYITKFMDIKTSISHLNEGVAITSLENGAFFSSKFKEEI